MKKIFLLMIFCFVSALGYSQVVSDAALKAYIDAYIVTAGELTAVEHNLYETHMINSKINRDSLLFSKSGDTLFIRYYTYRDTVLMGAGTGSSYWSALGDDIINTNTGEVNIVTPFKASDTALFEGPIYNYPLPPVATKVGRILHINQYGQHEWVHPLTLYYLQLDSASQDPAPSPYLIWAIDTTKGAIYQADLTNKVGIGTNSPAEMLHVDGNIRVEAGDVIKVGTVTTLSADYSWGRHFLFSGGNATMTGSNNFAIMPYALLGTTSGYQNMAIGPSALRANTTGFQNIAIGQFLTMRYNTTGSQNIAIGDGTLTQNTSGIGNVAIGLDAMDLNTTGDFNTGVGYDALFSNTTADSSSAFGVNALMYSTGKNNSGFGADAGRSITTGLKNTMIGMGAGYHASQKADAENSIALGYGAFTTKSNQAQIGSSAITETHLYGETIINDELVIFTNGDSARMSTFKGANSDGGNIWIGGGGAVSVGDAINTHFGSKNVSIGVGSLEDLTTGYQTTAIGFQSAQKNTTGVGTVAVGYFSLRANTTGAFNVGVGSGALAANTTGERNTAIGHQGLSGNTTGGYNTAGGFQSLSANETGDFNTAYGYYTLTLSDTGNFNTAIGARAGLESLGSNNVFLGAAAGTNISEGSNNIIIGAHADTNTVTSNNRLVIGELIEGVLAGNKSVTINGDVTTTGKIIATSAKYWIGMDSLAINTTDLFFIGYTPYSLALDTIAFTMQRRAGSPDVTVKIYYGNDMNSAGTAVVTAGNQITTYAGQTKTATFNNGTIPGGSAIWAQFSAVAVKPKAIFLTLIGK